MKQPVLEAVLLDIYEWCSSWVVLWLWLIEEQQALLTTFQQHKGVNGCFALCLRPISINIHAEGKFSGESPCLLLDLAWSVFQDRFFCHQGTCYSSLPSYDQGNHNKWRSSTQNMLFPVTFHDVLLLLHNLLLFKQEYVKIV